MHDLTLAAQFADRLVLLSDGRVIASGPPADVLDEKVLSACFGGRVRVLTDDDGQLLVVPQRSRRRIGC
jgi:iron complex transport system ATP-binding protein